ncbi:MAG: hypothetical protein KC636_35150 [Myxococcales bacterium]|nr:hypothetical protein [Myxococcales bacterium]
MYRTQTRWWIASAALGLWAGCDAAPPASPRAGVVAEPAADEPAVATKPKRGPVIGGEPIEREIDWPSADALDLEARARLDGDVLEAVDRAPVPVLLPSAPLEHVLVVTGERWFSLRGEQPGGVTVVVTGSGLATHYPGSGAARFPDTLRGHEGVVSINEGIRHASWIERGAAYSLELECASPEASPCDSDQPLRALVEGLAFVGGAAVEEVVQ